MARNSTLPESIEPKLYLAFELGQKQWKLGFTIGMGQAPRIRTIDARNLEALQWELELARRRFGLPVTSRVLSCYEAGRDGFWLHRYLEKQDVENLVVDSASIEVNRRARRAKSDRLDASKLVVMRMRYEQGERKLWRVVNVPSEKAEDDRHLHRELHTLKTDRTRHSNRIKGLLAAQGVSLRVGNDFLERLPTVRLWDGRCLPEMLTARLEREYQRIQLIEQQIGELQAQRRELLRTSEDASIEKVRQLMRLRGIGINSAWLYVMEFFSWRKLKNRREVGALAGLTPTPYNSGGYSREQGISKAGNRHVRAIAIEIAWSWLHHQPQSKLSQWYQQRFAEGGSRMRKIGIVALARKLLIELWRFLETGALPEGAELKP